VTAFVTPGWGSTPFGTGPFGGALPSSYGGHIPASAPFDIYNVTPGGDMSVFASYLEVQILATGGQVGADLVTGDFKLTSGGVAPSTNARVLIHMPVPEVFTFEATVNFLSLPADFTSLPTKHALFSVSDQQGCTFGLFFSLVGIAYTGSVHFDGGENLQVNSPVQVLPNSLNVVQEDTFYTLRVAIDSGTKTAFIYITESSLIPSIGHQLKYILPAFESASSVIPPTDLSYLSVRGTGAAPVTLQLDEIALGHNLLIPNLPPVADTGRDQASRSCTIVRLDGRASFDPEGAPLTYRWRLVDGPDTSTFVHPGHDGSTHAVGQTNKFYSVTLAGVTVAAGDVVLIRSKAYTIVGTGADGFGFYVTLDGYYLDGTLVSENFKLLSQRAISGPLSPQPTFFPDVPGIYRFDLVVNDGGLSSLPSTMIVNVTESPVPRGITPDLSFLWHYLSDFWRLVENTDVVQTFWGALAQIAASELLTLWQHDYGKSLRDIQRTFQRRWLHYDLYIREPFPEQTTVEALYFGVESRDLPVAGVTATGFNGNFKITSPLFPDFPIFVQPNTDPVTVENIRQQVERQLKGLDKRFEISAIVNTSGTLERILITAPFLFSIVEVTTSYAPFQAAVNGLPRGTLGAVVGINTYLAERRLDRVGVREGDHLIVDGVAYRIARVITDPTDQWPGQRIVTSDPLPPTIGRNWTIARGVRSKFLDFYLSLCSPGDTAIFEVIDLTTQSMGFTEVPVLTAAQDGKSCLLVDTAYLSKFLSQPTQYTVYFHSIYRRTHMPVDPLVVEVPGLQELIRNTDDSAVLRQNVDFYIEQYRGRACLRFVTSQDVSQPDVWQHTHPPQRMWAETTYLDNRPTIEANFGLLADFTLDDLSKLPNHTDYLAVVQGLWFAYFNGPTLANLRAGTQILLGLPFAEEAGTIVEIRSDFSTTTGRILVRDKNSQEIVRSYTYPVILGIEKNPATKKPYAVGDTVKQFAPLVTGVEVSDYLSDPRWYEGYLNQGVFLEVEKFFKFLVRVDSAAFSLDALLFAQSFVKKIKPTYTYPLFVVLKKLDGDTTVDVTDGVTMSGRLHINAWPCSFSIDSGPFGHLGGAYDDPRTAYGGWRGIFDGDNYHGPVPTSPGVAAVYPTPVSPIHWGFDREKLAPMDVIWGVTSTTLGAPTPAAFDGILSFDLPTFQHVFGTFGTTTLMIPAIPPHTTKVQLGEPTASTGTGTISAAILQYHCIYPLGTSLALNIEVFLNGVLATPAIPLTLPAGSLYYTSAFPIAVSVTAGDLLMIRLSTTGSDVPMPGGGRFFVALGDGTTWAFDSTIPAGTYRKPRMM